MHTASSIRHQGGPLLPPTATHFAQDLQLQHLSGTTLYYPCSGRDWTDPLRLFGPWVENIRFVDSNYYCNGKSIKHTQLGAFPEWKFLSRQVEGAPGLRLGNSLGPNIEDETPGFEPCAVSEVYQHLHTRHEVTIHWHRGDGRKTLDRFEDPIGVFFHRGDTGPSENPGEGSSGSHWLSKTWLEPVIQRMVNRGFIVTDGSCGTEYPELCAFHRAKIGEESVSLARDFIASDGVQFKCVGFAGMKYGPTLIWQITKPDRGDGA